MLRPCRILAVFALLPSLFCSESQQDSNSGSDTITNDASWYSTVTKTVPKSDSTLSARTTAVDICTDLKHRRTLTTPQVTTKLDERTSELTTTSLKKENVTPTAVLHQQEISSKIGCSQCDKIYGTCDENGECGCQKGFKQLGKICIDINECNDRSTCPANARCINTVGSYECQCDVGFDENGACNLGPDVCEDQFDVRLAEEDCNSGKEEIRYYYDPETTSCRQFFYGGCISEFSRNLFSDLQTCDTLCAEPRREYLTSHGVTKVHENPQKFTTPAAKPRSEVINPNFLHPFDTRNFNKIPGPLDLKPIETTTLTIVQKLEEVEKIERLVTEITPKLGRCSQKFEEMLREECVTANWIERFYWNLDIQECEPFWYDSSCDPREIAGKNFFYSYESCQQTCHEETDAMTQTTIITPIMPINATVANTPETTSPPHLNSHVPTSESTLQIHLKSPTPTFSEAAGDQIKYRYDSISDSSEAYEQQRTSTITPTEAPIEATEAKFDVCALLFDNDLRNECATGQWEELFYYNPRFKDCEPFWYDGSCGEPNLKDVNLFTTYEGCKEICITQKKREKEPKLAESKGKIEEALVPMQKNMTEPIITSFIPEVPEIPMIKISEPDPEHADQSIEVSDTPETSLYSQEDPLRVVENDDSNKLTVPPEIPGSNFGVKSDIGVTPFDREKYMRERKGRLNALPAGFTGKPLESKTESIKTRRPPFTLPPHIFKELNLLPSEHPPKIQIKNFNPTLSTRKVLDSTDRPSFEARKLPEISQKSDDITFKLLDKSEEDQKDGITKSIDETLSSLTKPVDPCDENLDPKLEEDCNNENWLIRYYYDKMKGTCKSFWYGNCPRAGQKNFFENKQLCIAVCGHKFGANDLNLKPTYALKPTSKEVPSAGKFVVEAHQVPVASAHPFEDLSDPNRIIETDHPDPDPYVIDPSQVMSHIIYPEPKKKIQTVTNSTNKSLIIVSTIIPEPTKAKSQLYLYSKEGDIGESKEVGQDKILDKPTEMPIILGSQDPEDTVAPLLKSSKTTEEPKDTTQFKQQEVDEAPGKPVQTTSISVGKKDPCDDEYDPKWEEDCGGDTWVVKTYFDAKTKSCKAFWYGHCPTESRNMWSDKEVCRQVCSHKFAQDSINPTSTATPSASEDVMDSESELALDDSAKERSGMQLSVKAVLTTKSVPQSHLFKLDLDQKFADIKREREGRRDLAYSKSHKLTVTVAPECLEPYDSNLEKSCYGGQKWINRSIFKEKKCVAFHWGGCRSASKNFFIDMGECQELCETPPTQLTQACMQDFDLAYKEACSPVDRFQQYYFFDHSTHTCKMFWYGNCKGESANIFPTMESCQWICERHREERSPGYCMDKFDEKYQESCGDGTWIEKWYFDQNTAECVSFWWDGCQSTSQNIFPDQKTCRSNCEHPGFEIESRLPDPESKFRCLEPIEIGDCKETYPAYYYDRSEKVCRPFSYSGCGGSGNRFMTIGQCEGLCYQFNHMTETEMDCNLPLHTGYGKNDEECIQHAGFRFYFDRDYGRCSQMWYLGCGGNANNFYSYEVCQRTCRKIDRGVERRPRASSAVCFETPGDKGYCAGNASRPVTRWTYSINLRCVQFMYYGCEGSGNRFSTESDCEYTCGGLKKSNDPEKCSHRPDSGRCNQLRYMWFYNQTRGTCDQFLYGGCDGNTNRFETFEICQKACEISGLDPCLEPLDRGSWCEAMSNRYFFNKRTRTCKGFHYTGCGKSSNNFFTKEECQQKCERRFPRAAEPQAQAPPRRRPGGRKGESKVMGYSGVKPKEKQPMLRHIVLDGGNKTYHMTQPQWLDYEMCYGYRYNVSGRDTMLRVHICSVNGVTDCINENYRTTEGEEYCNIVRPFLRGKHLYSFYFGLDIKDPPYIINFGKSGRIQRENETIATILLLNANHCYEIC
ncbi:hypothetical protein WR25_24580 [Diploscapter pachys]|uniref:Uncharacterized protein n=1 Tax=Diploscapter pachys TaxID=2018661 RepID=A0A2A2LZ62_9BILA|nr:hypothetical protein WR25_24580 [Diploscapter pachys]